MCRFRWRPFSSFAQQVFFIPGIISEPVDRLENEVNCRFLIRREAAGFRVTELGCSAWQDQMRPK